MPVPRITAIGMVETSPDPVAPFNFGLASQRDEILYTCERPGAAEKNEVEGATPPEEIQLWVDFMKSQSVKRVVTLLEEKELSWYGTSLFEIYEREGFNATHAPFGAPDSKDKAIAAIKAAEEAGEIIVAHCTHGKGRAGRVAAAWLVERYGLSLIEATQEVMEQADTQSTQRMGEVPRLAKFLGVEPPSE